MYTRNLGESEVSNLLYQSASRLHELVSSADESVYINNKATSTSLVQKYIMSGASDSIKKLILDTCFRAEASGPGSGDLIIRNIGQITAHYQRLKKYNPGAYADLLSASRDLTTRSWILESRKFNSTSLDAILDEMSPEVRSLVEEAIEWGSPTSTFKVQRSNETASRTRRSDGYRFEIRSPVSEVTGRRADWTRKSADIIVIDGIIESVSEIHHLLERYAESKQPLCIVCRNAAPEILTTLRHNFLRGTLDVVLCTFGYDEIRSNLLVDAAVCANVDVVSSLQGDLISTSIEKIGNVDRITLADSYFSLVNSGNSESVNAHKQRLLKRIEGADPAVAEILQKRLSCLVGDIVNIHVGTDLLDRNPRAIEEIDSFLRTLTGYIKSGSISRDEMIHFLNDNKTISSLLGSTNRDVVQWQLPEMLPASSFLSFVRYTVQLSVDLIGIGLIVEKES